MISKRREEVIREVNGERFIGQSPAMQQVLEDIAALAPLDMVVVLLGETGVGKDLVARLIHANSRRRHQPFVGINCANFQDDLLESECFGSTKGAFTGAESRTGLFRQADGGTLYLNELQDLSRRHQAKLKEFLDTGHIRPVGAERAIRLDVRLIVATHGDLEQIVEEKQFARDFYERLGHHRIQIQPLRERGEDIPALVEYFLEQLSRKHKVPRKELTAEAIQVLMHEPWSENVGQLQKVVEAAWLRSRGPKVEAAHLTRALQPWDGGSEQPDGNATSWTLLGRLKVHGLKKMTDEYEKQLLKMLLPHCGSARQAARCAQLDPKTLREKIAKFDLK